MGLRAAWGLGSSTTTNCPPPIPANGGGLDAVNIQKHSLSNKPSVWTVFSSLEVFSRGHAAQGIQLQA